MRHTCEWQSFNMDELCGKPAVDFFTWTFDGKIQWLCAEHYDLRQEHVKMVREILRRHSPRD